MDDTTPPAFVTTAACVRIPARITRLPALAAAMVGPGPGRRAAGVGRLLQVAAKPLYFFVHQTLGLAAPARLVVHRPQGDVAMDWDARDTAFLQFLQHRTPDLFEPLEGAFLERVAEGCACVHDIGANAGFVSLLLATAPGFAGRVEAVEAAPATASRLTGLVAAAGLDARIRVHALGLSDRDGVLRLASGRHSGLNHLEEQGPGAPVPVARLDRLVADGRMDPPDLMKIDVEGHEVAVLAGAADVLARHRPVIVIESAFRPAAPAAMAAPLVRLEQAGYMLFRLTAPGGRPPGPGPVPRLGLTPLPVALRASWPGDLNLVAWPQDRMDRLRALFDAPVDRLD